MLSLAIEVADQAQEFPAIGLALLAACGGALVTVVGALLGTFLQGKREHKKWLRGERVGAYARYLAHVDEFRSMWRIIEKEKRNLVRHRETQARVTEDIEELEVDGDDAREQVSSLRKELRLLNSRLESMETRATERGLRFRELSQHSFALMSAIEVLGPNSVTVMVGRLNRALKDKDFDTVRETRKSLVLAIKKILGTAR